MIKQLDLNSLRSVKTFAEGEVHSIIALFSVVLMTMLSVVKIFWPRNHVLITWCVMLESWPFLIARKLKMDSKSNWV